MERRPIETTLPAYAENHTNTRYCRVFCVANCSAEAAMRAASENVRRRMRMALQGGLSCTTGCVWPGFPRLRREVWSPPARNVPITAVMPICGGQSYALPRLLTGQALVCTARAFCCQMAGNGRPTPSGLRLFNKTPSC